MRSLASIVLAALLLAPAAVAAQAQGELEAAQLEAETARTEIITKNLPLTPQEEQAFWPVQRQYRAEMRKLNDRAIGMLKQFAENYEALTDAQAKTLLDESLKLADARVKLQKSYAGKVSKALPPQKALRYWQIENKMDAVVAMGAARMVPLAK